MNYKIPLLFAFLIVFISCEEEPVELKDSGSLPVFKLTTAEKYLWSPDSGLYVIGSNGIKLDKCPCVANYNQKWEYPAFIEYFEDEELKFSDDIGFRIKGNCSRDRSMKSLGFYWRKEYGNKKLDYHMFPDIPLTTFRRLLLRNSGNDFGFTHIKDASFAMIYRDYANVDYQEYKPCVLYLNDEYWGIYNIREMITPRHFQYHYDVDDDEVDLLGGSELDPVVDDGSADDFMDEVIGYLQSNDLSNDDNYQEFLNRIDIDSYIDNIIINTYIANTDWPCNNTKWWRNKTSANHRKWRWVVYDTDRGFKAGNDDVIWMGDLYGTPYVKEKKSGFFIFNNLIKNKGFRTTFLERYMFFIDVVFEKNRVKEIIKKNQHKIELEYSNHQKKWNTLSHRKWIEEIDDMIEFNISRIERMRTIIMFLQNENK